MSKLLLVINPCAGQRKIMSYRRRIERQYARMGYEVDTWLSSARGETVEYVAKHAPSYGTIVCAGGDGTLHEVINGVAISGYDRAIGYIPCGSTNDCARNFGLPTKIMPASRQAVSDERRYLDMGLFDDKRFVYVASFGLFTKASYATNQKMKNNLGHIAYLIEGSKELFNMQPVHMRFVTDDSVYESDYIFGSISNALRAGGGVLRFPDGEVAMDDGEFEVLLMHYPRNITQATNLINAVTSRQLKACPYVDYFRASHIVIEQSADINWTLDGEMFRGKEKIEFSVLNKFFRLNCK